MWHHSPCGKYISPCALCAATWWIYVWYAQVLWIFSAFLLHCIIGTNVLMSDRDEEDSGVDGGRLGTRSKTRAGTSTVDDVSCGARQRRCVYYYNCYYNICSCCRRGNLCLCWWCESSVAALNFLFLLICPKADLRHMKYGYEGIGVWWKCRGPSIKQTKRYCRCWDRKRNNGHC